MSSSWTCAWVDDEGSQCAEPAEPYAHMPLCDEHRSFYSDWRRGLVLSLAKQSTRFHTPETFPGLCYFLLLPDGTVKIGYSNTEGTLANRIKVLAREYSGPVIRLAVVPGGFVTEALMHDRFRSSRIPGPGERFRLTEDLAECLNVGLPTDGRPPTDPPEPPLIPEPRQAPVSTSRTGVVNY